MEISHYRILKSIKNYVSYVYRHLPLLLILTSLVAIWGLLNGWGSAAPKYSMIITAVVNPGNSQAVNDITLTNTCVAVLKEPQIYGAISRIVGFEISEADCQAAFQVSSSVETAIINIDVSWHDAAQLIVLSQAFKVVSDTVLDKIASVSNVTWVDGLDLTLRNDGRSKWTNGLIYAIAGAFIGMFLSICIIAVMMFFDTRVYRLSQLEDSSQQLCVIMNYDKSSILRFFLPKTVNPPSAPKNNKANVSRRRVNSVPTDMPARKELPGEKEKKQMQYLRMLTVSIMNDHPKHGTCILFLPGNEGRPIEKTVVRIANMLANSGKRVLLVSGVDMTNGAEARISQSDVLENSENVVDTIVFSPIQRRTNSSSVLSLVEENRNNYDIVFIEGKALTEQTDSYKIFKMVDSVLPIFRLRETRLSTVEKMMFELGRLKANIAGIVWTTNHPEDLEQIW